MFDDDTSDNSSDEEIETFKAALSHRVGSNHAADSGESGNDEMSTDDEDGDESSVEDSSEQEDILDPLIEFYGRRDRFLSGPKECLHVMEGVSATQQQDIIIEQGCKGRSNVQMCLDIKRLV